jgi:predicted ABC-type ATPase
VDAWTVLAGVLFMVWPLQYRWSISRVRRRVKEGGGDVERFERAMDRRWIRVMLVASPAIGVLLIVGGVTGAL